MSRLHVLDQRNQRFPTHRRARPQQEGYEEWGGGKYLVKMRMMLVLVLLVRVGTLDWGNADQDVVHLKGAGELHSVIQLRRERQNYQSQEGHVPFLQVHDEFRVEIQALHCQYRTPQGCQPFCAKERSPGSQESDECREIERKIEPRQNL